MKLAVHCANLTWPGGPARLGSHLADVAKAADQGGIATLTLMDHWFQMEQLGGPSEPMIEGYTGLGFLAGQTERIELGLLVTGVTYRHPGLLAKIATTLDVLSGGRAMLGLGAAWYQREHQGLGVPYPPTKERFERLEEALQICRQMFSGEGGTYEGTHYRLAEAVNIPGPLQEGGPRVLIGGAGEKKTLRLVAKYAAACNLFDVGADEVRHKLEVLDGHCETEGRDPATVQRTIMSGGDPRRDDWIDQMAAYAELGIDQVWVQPDAEDPAGSVNEYAERLVPRLAELG